MKSLIFGVVLILILGVGGFVYKNVMETGKGPLGSGVVACTADAKLCPDGSGVGRVGPECEFAPCPLPNIELPQAHLSFVLPDGYVTDENAYGADTTLLGAFVKPAGENIFHTITVRSYSIEDGMSADEVMLAHTVFQPADMQATSKEKFAPVLINGRTFEHVVVERFEALVESTYYLVREKDVLAFDITEHNVSDWMEPSLDVGSLTEHKALLSMLSTIQEQPH